MERQDVIFAVMDMIRCVEKCTGLQTLDLTSKEVLGRIAAAQARNEPARVTEIIKLQQLGTPPTLFSRVSQLEVDGWIASEVDATDKRVKRLTLTPKARDAYSRMSAGALKIIDNT